MALDMGVAYKIAASVTGQQSVDNLKNSMTGLERAGFSASNAFSSLRGAALGLAAGFSALTVIQQATQAIREEEVAQGRLNGLLKATQFSAGLTAKELGNLADSIEDVAGQFNGEQIRDGISTLLKFGNIGGEVFKEATQLSVDLASALGTDVSGAAQQVGRALADPVDGLNALRRAGVIFNDVQKEEIKLLVEGGDSAAAQAKVLELLRSRVGGVAQELNTGLNKQLAASDRAYGDFLKTVGNSSTVQGATKSFFDFLTVSLMDIDRIVTDGDFIDGLKFAAGFRTADTPDEVRKIRGGGAVDSSPDPQADEAKRGAALAAQRQEQERLAEAERKRREEAEKAAEAAAKEAIARAKSFNGLIAGMTEEISKTQELSRVELELQRISLGKYGPLSAANKSLLLEKAAQIDAANMQKKAEDEASKAAEKRRTEAQQAFEATKSEVTRLFEETRSPIEKLNIEMARLDELLAMGAIDFDLYSRAVFKATDEFDNFGKETKTGFDELEDAIRGFGNQATDAIVGFVTGAKVSFSGLIDSVLQDLLRLTVQKGITGPLFGAITNTLGGLFGGGLTEFGPTPFANGGVMTGSGSMPLQMYANGGVATSPQVAVFGEGTTPEAFVPLPDGRSIPVTVTGGGGGVNVTVNVAVESGNTQDGGGQDRASNLGRLVAGVVREELLKQKRPGGLLAV